CGNILVSAGKSHDRPFKCNFVSHQPFRSLTLVIVTHVVEVIHNLARGFHNGLWLFVNVICRVWLITCVSQVVEVCRYDLLFASGISTNESADMSRSKRSHCPIAFALDIFGDKWSLLVLRDLLLKDKQRFGELLAAEERIST